MHHTDTIIAVVALAAIVPAAIVSITQERTRTPADPNKPSFVPGHQLHLAVSNLEAWRRDVLPVIATKTFRISSGVDLEFFKAILGSVVLPDLHRHVTSLMFDRFYWFSGVKDNRVSNPDLVAASRFSSLKRLALTFHAAGLTDSLYGEHQRLAVERDHEEKSRELRPLRLNEVTAKYDLKRVYRCGALKELRLECLESGRISHYCKADDPLAVFWQLKGWFDEGFRREGMMVVVSLEAKNDD
jgi:hypothetical protein